MADLTPREREILDYLARTGEPNKDIARHFDIRPETVKVHIRHILTKLGVVTRTQAAIAHLKENR